MSKRKMFHDLVDNTVDAAIRVNINVREVFSEENLLKTKKRLQENLLKTKKRLQENVVGAKLLGAVRFVSEIKYRKYTIAVVTFIRDVFENILTKLGKKDSK